MALTEKEFLARIAARRGRPVLESPPPRPGHVRARPVPPANMAGREAMADWFARELTRLSGTVEIVTGLEAAGQAAAAHIARVCAPGDVIFWDDPIARSAQPPIEAAGFTAYLWPQERFRCAGAVAGVTTALFAVAETGSIALNSSAAHGRIVSLLPPLHVAIVPTSRLLATVGDYFKEVAAMDHLPAALNLVTGPSRTADIEMELSIGVHGPASLHVVLYDDWLSADSHPLSLSLRGPSHQPIPSSASGSATPSRWSATASTVLPSVSEFCSQSAPPAPWR